MSEETLRTLLSFSESFFIKKTKLNRIKILLREEYEKNQPILQQDLNNTSLVTVGNATNIITTSNIFS